MLRELRTFTSIQTYLFYSHLIVCVGQSQLKTSELSSSVIYAKNTKESTRVKVGTCLSAHT